MYYISLAESHRADLQMLRKALDNNVIEIATDNGYMSSVNRGWLDERLGVAKGYIGVAWRSTA